MKIFRKILTALSVAVLAVGASVLPAHAYGQNTWTVQPSGCNAGQYYGSSSWYNNNVAVANSSESGNFCWTGNRPVSAQVAGRYSWEGSGTVWAANYASITYSVSYNSGWGGIHSWGDATGRRT